LDYPNHNRLQRKTKTKNMDKNSLMTSSRINFVNEHMFPNEYIARLTGNRLCPEWEKKMGQSRYFPQT